MSGTSSKQSDLPRDERHRRLDQIRRQRLQLRGWRIEFYSESSALIVHSRPISHALHGFLTLITAGCWLIPWLWLVAFAGEQRELIFVHPDGTPEIHRVR